MTKCCIISDTHGFTPEIPPCDIFIHAGDIFPNKFGPWEEGGNTLDAKYQVSKIGEYNKWLNNIKAKHIVLVPGNHDFYFEEYPNHEHLLSSVHVLNNTTVELEGVKIWGSPITPFFFDWAFNGPESPILAETFFADYWKNIPENTDIVITHGPPLNILDLVVNKYSPYGTHCGEYYLKQRIFDIKPKIHCFGHIHYSHGIEEINGVNFINASYVNESYNPANPIIEIEV